MHPTVVFSSTNITPAPVAQLSFFAQIDHIYGHSTLNLFKSYASSYQKLGNMQNRKDFLIKCRRDGLIPSHIVHSLKCVHELIAKKSPLHSKLSRTVANFQKSLLNVEIQDTFHVLSQLSQQIVELKQQIIRAAPDHHKDFIFTQEIAYFRNYHRRSEKTNRKYSRMLHHSCEVHTGVPTFNQKAIFNATTKQAPEETNILLSLGPKFALPYTSVKQIPFFHFIADVENILAEEKDRNIRETNRCQIINKTQNYIHHQTASSQTSLLDKFCRNAVIKTKQFIQQNPDILITEADKGNRTVIMYAEDYNTKMNALLNDNTIYKPVKADPTSGIQEDNNSIVRRLFQLNLIDTRTKRHLSCYNGTCPRIYGQPKAHKTHLPLRPVVPNITAPTYNLSKYISKILKHAFTSQFNVKDSRTFCEYINNLHVPPDHILVSFDVVSLFTNIPKHLVTHDIIMSWSEISPSTAINLDLFLEIVEFCIDSSYFCFQQRYFKQIFGTAMGSPLSPILADIATETLLLTVAATANIPAEHIRKYVDDLFLVLPKDQVDEVLHVFNSYNPHLQFTCEVEQDGKLPFLDLLVIRGDDNTLRTDWYAKPIASGRILNYFSMHPLDQKMGVATSFVNRVRTLSTAKPKEQQNQLIFEYLRQNDYPKQLINRMLHQNTRSPSPTRDPLAVYRSIPQIAGLTPSIKRIIQTNNPSIHVTCSNRNTIKQLYNTTKDALPNTLKSNVVYKVSCVDCSSCYIGMTSNHLRDRMYGHQTNINTLERLLESGRQADDAEILQLKEKTALIEHCIVHQHRFDLKNPQIVDSTFRTRTLATLEMCQIATTPNTVNRRTDTDGLSCAYAHLLSTIARSRERTLTTTNPNNNNNRTDQLNTPQPPMPPQPAP